MRTCELLSADYERALAKLDEQPVYAGSHRKREGNEVGFLGEAVTERLLRDAGVNFSVDAMTSHDLRLSTEKSIEVKTKDRTVRPKLHYDCSVPLYNHEHQNVDYYIFVSLERDKLLDGIRRFRRAHLVGVANRTMLDRYAVVWDAGQTDPDNGTTFWTACRNIRIEQLVSFDQAVRHWLAAQDTSRGLQGRA